MASFRFVHAADLHLDTPFEGIGRVSPGMAEALRDASLDALDALVEVALSQDAAFLVIAGDLYDGPERGVRAQLRFLRAVERLREAGVRVFVVQGNHDAHEGWSAVARWPENVTFFGSGEVGTVVVQKDGDPVATVHGVSFPQPDTTENLALKFSRGDGPGLHVGVLHCNVGGRPEHEPYSPCSLDDLRRANLDYWALGHVHQGGVLHREDPWVAYSGNTQGRSPKPSELGAKGAYVVTVQDGAVSDVAFHALDRVRFANLAIDVSGLDDMASLRGALEEGLEALRAEHSGRGLVVRATLAGRGGLHDDLARTDAVAELLDDLREEAEDLRPLVWWERFVDRTRPAVSREAILKRDDFSAELLRAADTHRQDPEKLSAFLESCLGGLERPSAVKRWLRQIELSEPPDLLDKAEDLALDLLESEE